MIDVEKELDQKEASDTENKKGGWFQPTENGWTISAYVFLVGLFYVLCVIIGLNISLVPKLISFVISVISPLLYGFVIAFIIAPAVSFIEKRVFYKWRRKRLVLKHLVCVAIAYVVVFALIVVGVIFLVPQVVSTYNEFASQFSANVVDLRDAIAGAIDDLPGAKKSGAYVFYNISSDFRYDVTDRVIADSLINPSGFLMKPKNTASQDEVQAVIDKLGATIVDAVGDALPGMLSSALNVLIQAKNIMLGVIISVYFLVCKKSLMGNMNRFAHTWFPNKVYRRTAWIIAKAQGVFRDYIVVRFLDSIIVALITAIGLIILRNPYALLISVIIGISALLPFIGPVIGIVICSIMMFFMGIEYTIGFAAIMVGVQLLDDRFIEPLLNKGYSQHRLAGIWIFAAVVISSGLFGLMGFLLGIPLFAFIYALLKDWSERKLRRAGHEVDTYAYGDEAFKKMIRKNSERRTGNHKKKRDKITE